MTFQSTTHGKWILTGEHAVLRGCPALVFPIYQQKMNFKYIKADSALEFQFSGEYGHQLNETFPYLFERGLNLLNIEEKIKGKICVENSLPLGTGLGGSAAISVNIANLFTWFKFISSKDILAFSRDLENVAHGESSGVDIAVSIAGQGIRYERNNGFLPIKMKWNPHIYLLYSGQSSKTKTCVDKVKDFIKTNPEHGHLVDMRMGQSVQMAEKALGMDRKKGFKLLQESIELANDCFRSWDLINPMMDKKMEWLMTSGAKAVKPTGSGDGGFILSLWEKEPSEEILSQLIPCSYQSQEKL